MNAVQQALKDAARRFAEKHGCTAEGSVVVVPPERVLEEYGTPEQAPRPWVHAALREFDER